MTAWLRQKNSIEFIGFNKGYYKSIDLIHILIRQNRKIKFIILNAHALLVYYKLNFIYTNYRSTLGISR